jgi:hypothetical protein
MAVSLGYAAVESNLGGRNVTPMDRICEKLVYDRFIWQNLGPSDLGVSSESPDVASVRRHNVGKYDFRSICLKPQEFGKNEGDELSQKCWT